MGLSPMVEDVKPDSEICRLDYDSQLFRFSNILSVVCFISHVIQTRAMQNVFFRTNGPYFQNKIESVPFGSLQEKSYRFGGNVIQYSRFRMTDDGNKTTVCGNRGGRSLFSRAVVLLPPPPPFPKVAFYDATFVVAR